MVYYVLVFILNFTFNIFKTMEIVYVYKNKLRPLLFNTFGITIIALLSTFFSIDSLMDGDYWIMIPYIAGSVLGKWFAMTHFENMRFKIMEKIIKK